MAGKVVEKVAARPLNSSPSIPESMAVPHADLQAARTTLTGQAERLRAELAGIDSELPTLLEGCELDAADVGLKATSLELLRLQHDRVGATLSRTLAALGRLDDHTFGLCLDCGRRIRKERMLAAPHAERCVPCEEARSGL